MKWEVPFTCNCIIKGIMLQLIFTAFCKNRRNRSLIVKKHFIKLCHIENILLIVTIPPLITQVFILPSAVGQPGVIRLQKIREHLFPRLTKATGSVTPFLSQTPLHSCAHTQSTHSFHLHNTVAALFPHFQTSAKKKRDYKITSLV